MFFRMGDFLDVFQPQEFVELDCNRVSWLMKWPRSTVPEACGSFTRSIESASLSVAMLCVVIGAI